MRSDYNLLPRHAVQVRSHREPLNPAALLADLPVEPVEQLLPHNLHPQARVQLVVCPLPPAAAVETDRDVRAGEQERLPIAHRRHAVFGDPDLFGHVIQLSGGKGGIGVASVPMLMSIHLSV